MAHRGTADPASSLPRASRSCPSYSHSRSGFMSRDPFLLADESQPCAHDGKYLLRGLMQSRFAALGLSSPAMPCTAQPRKLGGLKNERKGWKWLLNERFHPIEIPLILPMGIVSPSGADPAENAPDFGFPHVLFYEAKAAGSPRTTERRATYYRGSY